MDAAPHNREPWLLRQWDDFVRWLFEVYPSEHHPSINQIAQTCRIEHRRLYHSQQYGGLFWSWLILIWDLCVTVPRFGIPSLLVLLVSAPLGWRPGPQLSLLVGRLQRRLALVGARLRRLRPAGRPRLPRARWLRPLFGTLSTAALSLYLTLPLPLDTMPGGCLLSLRGNCLDVSAPTAVRGSPLSPPVAAAEAGTPVARPDRPAGLRPSPQPTAQPASLPAPTAFLAPSAQPTAMAPQPTPPLSAPPPAPPPPDLVGAPPPASGWVEPPPLFDEIDHRQPVYNMTAVPPRRRPPSGGGIAPPPTEAPLPPTGLPISTAIVEPSPIVTELPTITPTVTVEISPTVTPTEGPSPTATEEPSPTPTATEEPSPTATEEPSPTATEQPSPTATEQPSPTATEQPSPTATELPSPTPTGTPAGQPVCSEAINIAPELHMMQQQVAMTVTLGIQPEHQLLNVQELAIQIFKNHAQERDVEVALITPDRSVLATDAVQDRGDHLYLDLLGPLAIPNPGATVVVRYRYDGSVRTSDDSFRVRFMSGQTVCARSAAFGSPGDDQGGPGDGRGPFSMQLMQPGPPQRPITSAADAAFEARIFDRTGAEVTSSEGGVVRVEFIIESLDEWAPEPVTVWQWSEYTWRYCVFGGDLACVAPPEQWWGQLAEGRYLLKASAYGRGSSRPVAESTLVFEKGRPSPTSTARPASATPTASPSPSATPSLTPNP